MATKPKKQSRSPLTDLGESTMCARAGDLQMVSRGVASVLDGLCENNVTDEFDVLFAGLSKALNTAADKLDG